MEGSTAVFTALPSVGFVLATGDVALGNSVAGNNFNVVPCAYRRVLEANVQWRKHQYHEITCVSPNKHLCPTCKLPSSLSLEAENGLTGAMGVLVAAKMDFPGVSMLGVPGIMSSSSLLLSMLELSAQVAGGTAGVEAFALPATVGFGCCPVPR